MLLQVMARRRALMEEQQRASDERDAIVAAETRAKQEVHTTLAATR